MRLDSPGVFWCTNMWRTTYLKPYRQGNDTLVKFKSRIQHLGSILKQERQINHPKGLVDRKPTTSFRMKATSSEGHKVPKSSVVSEQAVDEEIKSFQEHQASAIKLSFAQEARTLCDLGRYGVISTISSNAPEGFPNGSVVGYAAQTENGLPIFAFSTLSSHTGDIIADPRCSLTVTSPNFKGAADGRVTLTGKVTRVPEDRLTKVKESYKEKHPNAFWIDFGDFSLFEMTELVHIRLVGGFARAGNIKPEEYLAAEADPVAQFSEPVCKHMNEDHREELSKYIKFYTGLTVQDGRMLSIDSLGMSVEATRDGQTFKVRLPFPEPALTRGAVKDQVVAMSRASSSAS